MGVRAGVSSEKKRRNLYFTDLSHPVYYIALAKKFVQVSSVTPHGKTSTNISATQSDQISRSKGLNKRESALACEVWGEPLETLVLLHLVLFCVFCIWGQVSEPHL